LAKWEVAIAVCDEPEAHRKKEGDIIAFKPAPWDWGKKELDQYLIVTIDGMSKHEVAQLCQPLVENGETDIEVIDKKGLKILKKRRYNFPLDILKNGWVSGLSLQKVRNKNLVYQPVKGNKIVIDTTERVSIFKDKLTGTYK